MPNTPKAKTKSQRRRQIRPPLPVEEKVAIAHRRERVMDLSVGGMKVAQIAEVIGVSKKVIYDDIKAKLTQMADRAPATELYRQKHLHRINYLLSVWWERAHNDLKALDMVIKLMAREARLLGLDAPSRHMLKADVHVSSGDPEPITIDMRDTEAARAYERLRDETSGK